MSKPITPIKSFINAAYNLVDDICSVDNLDVEPSDDLKNQLALMIENVLADVWTEGYEEAFERLK